uniref:tRNA-synt_1d domain-containing protein n=1 Tax=Strongyloides venezuelensis TaxID=75913 RepID=A0A0K0FFH1_STRVS
MSMWMVSNGSVSMTFSQSGIFYSLTCCFHCIYCSSNEPFENFKDVIDGGFIVECLGERLYEDREVGQAIFVAKKVVDEGRSEAQNVVYALSIWQECGFLDDGEEVFVYKVTQCRERLENDEMIRSRLKEASTSTAKRNVYKKDKGKRVVRVGQKRGLESPFGLGRVSNTFVNEALFIHSVRKVPFHKGEDTSKFPKLVDVMRFGEFRDGFHKFWSDMYSITGNVVSQYLHSVVAN